MEKNIKTLEKELKYLTKEARTEEIEKNKDLLNREDVNIKEISNNIYVNRGLDISKIDGGIIHNLTKELSNFINGFEKNSKEIKRKMFIEVIYMILLVILLKIPFDLVRDIGYDYIKILSTNGLIYTLWQLLFLILYTITGCCTIIVLIRNFNKKYNK